jgi:hypothetical protein
MACVSLSIEATGVASIKIAKVLKRPTLTSCGVVKNVRRRRHTGV